MKRIILLPIFIIQFFLFPLAGYSQTTRTITGTIYSNNTMQPIQGASVVSKTTNSVLVSDDRGNFVFTNLGDSDTLYITYIGHIKKEIPVSGIGQSPIEVFLEPSNNYIDEVVVNTGYQSLPKERATGSFTHIDNDLFNRSVSVDLISRLEGITNGLSYELPLTRGAPSSTPNLRIRGLSTINGETEPLIVVDNFPYEGDINNINPNDVESITVLKDAAAASIWGARAGNGVIVITTKNGAISRRPKFNINSNISITERPDLHYSRRFLPPVEAVELERMLFDRGLYAKNDWTSYTPAIEVLFALDEEIIDEVTANRMLNDLKQYDIRDDAANYLYRQSLNQQYAMNINGGVEKHQYYVSVGLDNNAANLIGDGYKRITLTTKNVFQPVPKLNISTSVNYMQSHSNNNGIGLLELAPTAMIDNPYVYMRLADENGISLPVVRNNKFTYTDNAPELGLLDWHYRPLDELIMNDNTTQSQEIRINTSVHYQLPLGFDFEVRYQYQSIGNSTRTHHTQDSYYSRNMINQFTQEDGMRPIPIGGILDRTGTTFASHYGRLLLDYNNTLADRHEINGLLGFEIRQERNENIGGSRLYGYNDEILTHATNLNFDSSFPTRPRSSGRIPYGNYSGNEAIDRFVSYFTNIAYTLDSKYILSTSVRWDASNIFGVDFNQKGVPLWSIGGAWNANNEPFFNVDWVNLTKLRLTYGSNGNVVRSLSSLPIMRYGSTNEITRLPMGTLLSVGNPDLSWEQVNTLNVGLDFALFKRRVSGSVEWYNKNSTNLIGADLFDPTVGIFLTGALRNPNLDNKRNYADLNTKGMDIELNTVNIDKSLIWQTTLLLSKVRNTVTNHHNPQNPLITDYLGSMVPVVEGVSRDQLYAIPWHGLDDTGAPRVMIDGELVTDYNTYFGNLTREDLLQIGVSMPPYFGSMRNTFTWRSFSASINILWKIGHKFRRESIEYNNLLGASKMSHLDYLDRWQNSGDELTTIVPSIPESTNLRRDQAYIFSEALYEKGDHFRLQDINLSYQLPQQYASSVGLSQVRLYAYARNLGILWKHTDYDIDPDARALYPQPLQVSFGLQIQL